MENKSYHTVRTVPNSSRKNDTTNTQIHCSTSGLDTGTIITSGRIKLVLFNCFEGHWF
jgi:hypothetical protein